MLVDKRKNHKRAVFLTKGDFEALHAELRRLRISDADIGMSFATAAELERLFIFTADENKLCFVEAKAGKPNFWHGPTKHLAQRLTDNGVEVLVSAKATAIIGDTYLQRILETVGKPMLPEHVSM